MFRTSIMASLIIAFFSIAAFAEDARQFTCSGTMVEPSAMSPSPETVVLTLGPAQKVALDLGKGVMNARRVSDNKIQLKFRTKDFEGEYFFSLYRRPILHLQIWASDEANVQET
jgi:hypothetical protein